MKNIRLIFVGGFLGAGKTTLLYELTRILTERGKKVGLITNDQAPDLADTSLLEHTSVKVAEVAGSCFCCDFKGLKSAINDLGKDERPDIIIAEPVGSCTDLSATLINPIKDIMKTEISVAPLTVLADPGRLTGILDGNSAMHPSAVYIIKKQLEESDVIAVSKSDMYDHDHTTTLTGRLKLLFPECEIMTLSAKSGEGLQEWLDLILTQEEAGKNIAEVNYDRYAEGEAVLGWLNCSASLSGAGIDWDRFTQDFMKEIARRIEERNLTVGHIKMLVENGDKYISANLTGNRETLSCRWSAGKGDYAEMIFNARVEMSPGNLEVLFTDSLKVVTDGLIEVKIRRLKSLSPGRPQPTYRYNREAGDK
jgi:G3E family GTPase